MSANMPRTGFAAAMREGERQMAAEAAKRAVKPPKKEQPAESKRPPQVKIAHEPYPWPRMVIGRRIDGHVSGAKTDWGNFLEKKLQPHVQKLDRVVPVAHLMCTFVSPQELSDMMTEKYSKVSNTTSESARKQKARDENTKINDAIRSRFNEGMRLENQYLLSESRDLRERVFDPNNIEWLDKEFAATVPLRDEAGHKRVDEHGKPLTAVYRNVWLPARFQTADMPVNPGLNSLGIRLEDSTGELREGRERVVKLLKDLGFDTRLVSREWEPVVDVVETYRPFAHPDPALAHPPIRVPGYPPTMPLASPHAYMPDYR